MSIKDQLETPAPDKIVNGTFTLNRIFRLETPPAAPVSPVNIGGIREITAGPLKPQINRQVFPENCYGPADLGCLYHYAGTIRIESGCAGSFMSSLLGCNWSTAGYSAMALSFPDFPLAVLESVCRREDNETHLFSKVYQDIMLRNFNFGSVPGEEIVEIPFYSRHSAFLLCAGTETVLDKFTGDGETTEFTLSAAPLNLLDPNSFSAGDWDFDNLVYVKIKQLNALSGTRQRDGVSVNGSTLLFDNPPPVDSQVSVLYARLTG
ncbi:hypothetical protein JXQ31_04050 [candidate division KSB1 bacterium]|nr:hypothetical protein [candidate division KSB1 bacterium]